MTQQFKFGDRVRYKELGAVGVVVDIKFDSLWVIFEGDSIVKGDSIVEVDSIVDFYDFDEFEPVPHPDTVRLDWLADPANKIGNVILPTECVERHLDSLRDAIDAAMQIQAPEAA